MTLTFAQLTTTSDPRAAPRDVQGCRAKLSLPVLVKVSLRACVTPFTVSLLNPPARDRCIRVSLLFASGILRFDRGSSLTARTMVVSRWPGNRCGIDDTVTVSTCYLKVVLFHGDSNWYVSDSDLIILIVGVDGIRVVFWIEPCLGYFMLSIVYISFIYY